jgi:hypothetical protein
MNIEFVRQPTDNSCLSACLAMLTKENVDSVIKEFHQAYHNHKTTLYDYLDMKNIEYSIPDAKNKEKDFLYKNHTYLLTVPSLNVRAGLHSIIAHVDELGILKIYDPQKGNEGKLFYTSLDDISISTKSVLIDSWIVDAKFKH